MKISLSWLRRYVDVDVPVEELCEKMIMSGFEVESVEDLSASMSLSLIHIWTMSCAPILISFPWTGN